MADPALTDAWLINLRAEPLISIASLSVPTRVFTSSCFFRGFGRMLVDNRAWQKNAVPRIGLPMGIGSESTVHAEVKQKDVKTPAKIVFLNKYITSVPCFSRLTGKAQEPRAIASRPANIRGSEYSARVAHALALGLRETGLVCSIYSDPARESAQFEHKMSPIRRFPCNSPEIVPEKRAPDRSDGSSTRRITLREYSIFVMRLPWRAGRVGGRRGRIADAPAHRPRGGESRLLGRRVTTR